MKSPGFLRAAIANRSTIDVAAVFAGRLGGVIVSLIFLPLYARLLTPADFGSVALLLSLQAFFLVSDLGFATVLARDTAIARDNPAGLRGVADDRRRAELILAGLVLIVSATAMLFASLRISSFGWLDALRVVGGTALVATLIMLNVAQSCLNALGLYPLSSALTTTGTVARAAVSAVVLEWISAGVDAFIWTQLAIAFLHYAVTRRLLDRNSQAGPVRLEQLVDRAQLFCLIDRCKGIMVYTLGGAAAVNLDKLILTAFFPISVTGWYFLSTTYALVPISLLSGPLNQYFAPRVAFAEGVRDHAARLRLSAAFQLLLTASVVLPAFLLIRHAPVLITLWLQPNPGIPQVIHLASILLVGTAIGATGYYPTAFLIAVADSAYLARLSAILAACVLVAATVFAAAGWLSAIAISYAIFHTVGCVALWKRIGTYWNRQDYRWLVLHCYLLPAILLLGVCLAIWTIASSVAVGWPALAIEIACQVLLGGGLLAILVRRCYRRAA